MSAQREASVSVCACVCVFCCAAFIQMFCLTASRTADASKLVFFSPHTHTHIHEHKHKHNEGMNPVIE